MPYNHHYRGALSENRKTLYRKIEVKDEGLVKNIRLSFLVSRNTSMDGNLSLSYSNDPTSSFPPGASFLLLPLTRSEDRRTPELRGPASEAVDCSGGEYDSTAAAALGGSVTVVVIESLGFFSFSCWCIVLGSRVEKSIFVRT